MFFAGQKYFIDTNVFIYAAAESGHHKTSALKLLEDLGLNDGIAVTSVLVLEEAHFIFYRQTKDHRQTVQFIRDIQKGLGDVFGITQNTVNLALNLFNKSKTKVSVKDYYHLASMIENHAETIISFDQDFDQFAEIVRFA
ncbi:MAG: type II toxin-antitoxin system VapC family toxin [Deltaproteobacteria bacterium]|nr:type II toxin-antitoxin system VapC family toxin [Deltaproteobacteria bacterium]